MSERFRAMRTSSGYWKIERMIDPCSACGSETRWRTLFYTYQLLPFAVQEEAAKEVAALLNDTPS